jgi:hypothetical protein
MRTKKSVCNLQSNSEEIETKLDEADKVAATEKVRYTEEEVFSRVKARIQDRK